MKKLTSTIILFLIIQLAQATTPEHTIIPGNYIQIGNTGIITTTEWYSQDWTTGQTTIINNQPTPPDNSTNGTIWQKPNITLLNPEHLSTQPNTFWINFTINETNEQTSYARIYINNTFLKDTTTNTTATAPNADYEIKIAAYNGKNWSTNATANFTVYVCPEIWACTNWTQNTTNNWANETRTCIDLNSCGTENQKPATTRTKQQTAPVLLAAVALATSTAILWRRWKIFVGITALGIGSALLYAATQNLTSTAGLIILTSGLIITVYDITKRLQGGHT